MKCCRAALASISKVGFGPFTTVGQNGREAQTRSRKFRKQPFAQVTLDCLSASSHRRNTPTSVSKCLNAQSGNCWCNYILKPTIGCQNHIVSLKCLRGNPQIIFSNLQCFCSDPVGPCFYPPRNILHTICNQEIRAGSPPTRSIKTETRLSLYPFPRQ
jgi:hypothetical protein